jgi:hypothetical protein
MTHPIIETNIERILEDHIFIEIDGLTKKIGEYQEQIDALQARKEKLIRVAHAAELLPSNQIQDEHPSSHYFR